MANDLAFSVNTCCRNDRYGYVSIDGAINIGASPHECFVVIDTVEDAEKLIAVAQAFIASKKEVDDA